MTPEPKLPWGLFLTALLALACTPNIGDKCALHSDCSQSGDRICDPTFPGGYCTIFNCEPGSCPSEAVCVAFNTGSALACMDPSQRRFEKTFCMKTCGGNGDCRAGYECLALNSPNNPVTAVVVETGGDKSRSVCTVAQPTMSTPLPDGGNVCSPDLLPDAAFLSDGAFGPLGPWKPPSDAASKDAKAAADASRDASAPRSREGGVDGAARDATGGP
jgi:hypothetical protein